MSKYLGDQWSVGDWAGMLEAAKTELPEWLSRALAPMMFGGDGQIPQRMKEYDPEWGRAFWEGSVFASCDHARMLASVKCPVLYTHHFRHVDDNRRLLAGRGLGPAGKARMRTGRARRPDDRLPFISANAAFDARRQLPSCSPIC